MVTFEDGLFILDTRVVSYDFIFIFITILIVCGVALFCFGCLKANAESSACGLIMVCVAIFVACFTPGPYTVVDAIVDPATPWSEISEKYELISVKDASKNICTFKVLKEEKSNTCSCSCNCKK